MTDGVLPRGPPLPVVRKLLDNEVADFTESEHFVRRLRDSHSYQSDVGVWRFHVILATLRYGRCLLAATGSFAVALVFGFILPICSSSYSGVFAEDRRWSETVSTGTRVDDVT